MRIDSIRALLFGSTFVVEIDYLDSLSMHVEDEQCDQIGRFFALWATF